LMTAVMSFMSILVREWPGPEAPAVHG